MRIHWDRFTYSEGTFSAELSDLSDLGFEENIFEDGFRNASFRLVGKTGATVTYVFSHRDMDGSNEDCYGYNFIPSAQSLAMVPKARGTKVLLIND